MKKTILLSFACLTIALNSCSKDDDATAPVTKTGLSDEDKATNAKEETSLNVDLVSKGLQIANAKKIQGNAPTPNGLINFEVTDQKQSALQKNGFDISLKTTDTYAGAYIQLKSTDGTLAGEYIDVPRYAFKKPSKKSNLVQKSFGQKSLGKKESDEETFTIDVNFDNSVPPGTFCYIICIYDVEGNIALPQEVCVEVEAWGGNSLLVGEWHFIKTEHLKNGTPVSLEKVNIRSCDSDVLYCEASDRNITIEDALCLTTKSIVTTLNPEGTFTHVITTDQKTLDYLDFIDNSSDCTPKFVERKNIKTYVKGNWAYNETTNELILVGFEISYENEDGIIENLENEDENETLVTKETVTLSGKTLILESDTSIAPAPAGTNTSKTYFAQ